MSADRIYFTNPGYVPFVVSDLVFATMRCRIPVIPGGDGAETEPLETRTARCGHQADRMVGSAPTCSHHLAVGMRIGGITPREPVGDCGGGLTPVPPSQPGPDSLTPGGAQGRTRTAQPDSSRLDGTPS